MHFAGVLDHRLRRNDSSDPYEDRQLVYRSFDGGRLSAIVSIACPPIRPRFAGGKINLAFSQPFFYNGRNQDVSTQLDIRPDEVGLFIRRKLEPKRPHQRACRSARVRETRYKCRAENDIAAQS